jgi:hypothetical protein
MARRLIKSIRVGRCAVKIYRLSDTKEYLVQTLTPWAGKPRVEGGEDGGAFETDPAAARGTAAFEVRRLRKKPNCRIR